MRRAVLMASMMVMGFQGWVQANDGWPSAVIGDHASDGSLLAMDCNTAVWSDGTENSDIYGYNFAGEGGLTLSTANDRQDAPVVSGNWIVWHDKRSGNYDIWGYDLNDPCERLIFEEASSSQKYPAISNGIVVWQDSRNSDPCGLDIYGYNLDTSSPLVICTASGDQARADISGNIIVWMDTRNGGNDIYGYNLTTLTEFEICVDSAAKNYPRISGNLVVWQECETDPNICGIDLTTLPSGSKFDICTATGNQTFPRISGTLVVWQDERMGTKDIYGKDLTTGGELVICNQTGDQTAPAISGERVIWQYNNQIYAATRPELSVITITSPNGGESYLAGTEATITWTTGGPAIENVKLEYSPDNGQNWSEIVASTPNNHSYSWTPLPQQESTQTLVRVSDAANPDTADTSNAAFTIFACAATLTADLNHDCIVDLDDLAMLCGQWLTCGNPYDPQWCP